MSPHPNREQQNAYLVALMVEVYKIDRDQAEKTVLKTRAWADYEDQVRARDRARAERARAERDAVDLELQRLNHLPEPTVSPVRRWRRLRPGQTSGRATVAA